MGGRKERSKERRKGGSEERGREGRRKGKKEKVSSTYYVVCIMWCVVVCVFVKQSMPLWACWACFLFLYTDFYMNTSSNDNIVTLEKAKKK